MRTSIKAIVTLLFFTMHASASSNQEHQKAQEKSACDGLPSEKLMIVPLIRLIANPTPYHGKCVMTSGFLSFEFEGNAIYLSYEDYSKRRFSNSAQLYLPQNSKHYNEAYYKDHEGSIKGVIENYNQPGSIEKTIIHLYKTRFQEIGIPLKEPLISRKKSDAPGF